MADLSVSIWGWMDGFADSIEAYGAPLWGLIDLVEPRAGFAVDDVAWLGSEGFL